MLDEHTINRRSVLQAFGSAPLLAAISMPAAALSSKEFLVMGSDPVMLNAALHLESAGKIVHIVETHQHVGGASVSSHVSRADADVVANALASAKKRSEKAARALGVELIAPTKGAPWFFDSSIELTDSFIESHGGHSELAAEMIKHLKSDVHLGTYPVRMTPGLSSFRVELSNGVRIEADHIVSSL